MTHLQGVATFYLPIYHVKYLFLNCIARRVTGRPVVCSSTALSAVVEVFGIVDVLVWAILYALEYLLAKLLSSDLLTKACCD